MVLATFFLVEKKGPQRERRREKEEEEDEKRQVLWPLRSAVARTPLGPINTLRN